MTLRFHFDRLPWFTQIVCNFFPLDNIIIKIYFISQRNESNEMPPRWGEKGYRKKGGVQFCILKELLFVGIFLLVTLGPGCLGRYGRLLCHDGKVIVRMTLRWQLWWLVPAQPAAALETMHALNLKWGACNMLVFGQCLYSIIFFNTAPHRTCLKRSFQEEGPLELRTLRTHKAYMLLLRCQSTSHCTV